jgi:hypothetical protein
MGLLVVAAGCRDDNKVVFYKPHVYKGQTEPALSQNTVAELEARAGQGGRP